jgi:beta-lactamase class A
VSPVRPKRAFAASVAIVTFVLASTSGPLSARRRAVPTPAPTERPIVIPSPTATPLSEGVRLSRLQAELDAIARTAPGRLGIAVVDVATGERFTVHGDEAFPLASVAKLAIATVAFRMSDQRKLDLDERIAVTRGDLRHDSDLADDHPRGASFALWELIRAMLVSSDNTASDVVLRRVGGPSIVTDVLRRLNIRNLTVRKSEAELAADVRAKRRFARGGENAGTPNALADLLVGIATQRYTLVDSTNEFLLDLDDVVTGRRRLRAGFPAALRLAHKTGTSATIDGTTDATNDAGIVTLPDGRRIAVVALLAESGSDEPFREAVLARVARAVANAYAP